MLLLYFAVLTVCSASAQPTRQKRFDVYDPFGYTYAYAGFPYAGAIAKVGFPFPGYYPIPFPPMPPIIIPDMKPWYKGENVCKEEVEVDATPQNVPEWAKLSDDTDSFDYKQTSQNCKGDNNKYVCRGRRETPEGIKNIFTKYECCHGFVRPLDGSAGCVESNEGEASSSESTAIPPTGSPIKFKDYTRYDYYKGSSSAQSAVGSVPAQ